jgi:hypothetical protein
MEKSDGLKSYRVKVYDLNDPLTVAYDFQELLKSSESEGNFDFGIASGPYILDVARNRLHLGRVSRDNTPDIEINHPEVSRRQGILIYDDGKVFYKENEKAVNTPRPDFRGLDSLERASLLRNKHPVELRKGEGLVFANSLELAVEES